MFFAWQRTSGGYLATTGYDQVSGGWQLRETIRSVLDTSQPQDMIRSVADSLQPQDTIKTMGTKPWDTVRSVAATGQPNHGIRSGQLRLPRNHRIPIFKNRFQSGCPPGLFTPLLLFTLFTLLQVIHIYNRHADIIETVRLPGMCSCFGWDK